MRKSFKYRLFTNKTQEIKLAGLFNSARFLYNSALEHRILCWKQWRKSINYYDQANTLKEIRSFDEGIAQVNYSASQDILRRLDKSFQAFFRRIKLGDKPGFPRFKGRDRFNSITFPSYGDGVRLKNGKLYIQNVGSVRIKLHRDLEGKIKTLAIKWQNGHFYACFSCDDIMPKVLASCANEIGIDVGIKSFAVMSNGEIVDNPKHLKQSEDKLKDLQRKHSKKRTRKTRKKLSRLHAKVGNQRKDFLHKLSRNIVNRFGFIFVEALKPKQMVNGNHRILNKYINDAAWAMFFDFLSYKAEWAGRVKIEVNPKGTTQRCSACGKIVPKDLSVRVHSCPCGLNIDRDFNAALNILRAGQALCFTQEAVCFS
ncbi:MAG: transposase [Gammaproteobacteria bacterium]|nr:transposase [Gammaproteobacteria bacterium]